MQLQSQTCSASHACTTAAWGLLALLQLPFLQSLYICTFTKLQPLPELPLYIFLQGLVRLSCTSPELMHLTSCTSTRAPRAHQLVHPYVCTSTRAPHLVNLTSCTSTCAPLRVHLVHLYACTSSHVHLYACTSMRAHLHMHLISHAPLVYHLHSCTNQTGAPIKPIRRHIQEWPGPFR